MRPIHRWPGTLCWPGCLELAKKNICGDRAVNFAGLSGVNNSRLSVLKNNLLLRQELVDVLQLGRQIVLNNKIQTVFGEGLLLSRRPATV